MLRCLPLVACCAGLLIALPAAAGTTAGGKVTGFDLLQVNQEVIHVKPSGSHPLCQAIPITAIRVHTSWSQVRKGSNLRLVFAIPGHGKHTRWIKAPASSGRKRVEFTPVTEKLASSAFPGGTYRATLRAGERSLSSATVKLTQATTTC
jgi:hypothetical protein